MAKGKIKKEKVLSPKKELRNKVTEQLRSGFTDLEEKVGKKEWEIRIKKAAKLLTAGIKIKLQKPAKAKPVKKEEPPIEAGSE